MNSPRTVRANGFTLIELMIVVALSLLVLRIALPNIARALEKEGMDKAVTDFMEGCKQARALAILTGASTELVIQAEDGRMSIRKNSAPILMRRQFGDTEAPPIDPPAADPSGNPPKSRSKTDRMAHFERTIPEDIALELFSVNFIDQMEYPEGIIRFHPNGTSDECSVVLLLPDNEGDVRRLISLNPLTGIARSQDPKDLR